MRKYDSEDYLQFNFKFSIQTSTARSYSPSADVSVATDGEETKSADIQEQGFGLWIIFGKNSSHKRWLDSNFMCTLFCFNKV